MFKARKTIGQKLYAENQVVRKERHQLLIQRLAARSVAPNDLWDELRKEAESRKIL